MLFSTSSLLVAPLLLASLASASSCAPGSTHRRHHNKHRKSTVKGHKGVSTVSSSTSASGAAAATGTVGAILAAKYAQAGSSSSSSSSSAAKASSTASTSSSSSSIGWGLSGLKKNGIYVGMLPDDGSGGGSSQTISTLNTALGGQAAAQGWYAQAQSGTAFTGSQLTSRMDQIKQGGVFQPAVMPTGGWKGLTKADNSQAVNICNVMKKFTDEGIEVWLRFAHEVNWYQEDGTYEGDVSDFKEGWAVVAAACKSIAPDVKMVSLRARPLLTHSLAAADHTTVVTTRSFSPQTSPRLPSTRSTTRTTRRRSTSSESTTTPRRPRRPRATLWPR